MHGLLNRAIECFVRDTYGDATWAETALSCGLSGHTPEPMLPVRPDLTDALVDAACRQLGKARHDLLEDLGIYLVRHDRYEGLRRLLRFSGRTFGEFILSLDELADRVRLVLPGTDFFSLNVQSYPGRRFEVNSVSAYAGFPRILFGALRAMADDYGVLATMDISDTGASGHARLLVTVHAPDFTSGRGFSLGARTA